MPPQCEHPWHAGREAAKEGGGGSDEWSKEGSPTLSCHLAKKNPVPRNRSSARFTCTCDVHAPALPTSRVCSSLNGSILQVASRCTDRQLPREHFYSPDTPEGCKLGMPVHLAPKSAFCRAASLNETTSASAASARAPRKFWPFTAPLDAIP